MPDSRRKTDRNLTEKSGKFCQAQKPNTVYVGIIEKTITTDKNNDMIFFFIFFPPYALIDSEEYLSHTSYPVSG